MFASYAYEAAPDASHSYLAAATQAMERFAQPLGRREGMPQEEMVMWLDICATDPSLSRLCVAPRRVFELPKHCEDERLTNGMRTPSMRTLDFTRIVCFRL